MFLFISKRIGQTVPVVLLVSFFVFFIINVIPGDPTITVLGNSRPPNSARLRGNNTASIGRYSSSISIG